MPAKKRHKTKYAGVLYIESTIGRAGKPERIYYIMYRMDGKLIEEKVGRQFQDDMTPARASAIRTARMQRKELPNRQRRQALKAAANGEVARWTVSRLWEEYRAQRRQNKALAVDTGRYLKYIEQQFGKKEPKEIIPLDVDRLRLRLGKRLKPQTIKHVLNLLDAIVSFGVKKGLCGGFRFKIKKPTVHNLRTEDLTREQMSLLLRAIEEDPHVHAGNLMKLVLFTGMRRGELFNLKWDNVDFERGFINIHDPKGGPSQTVPLNEAARNLLLNHIQTESPFVFPGRHGKRRVNISEAINRIKHKAGLPKDFRPLHGLRHAYASMLASSGKVDMYTLQRLLTHKSPVMTQRYAHLRDETLKRAADVAGDLIEQAVNGKSQEKVVHIDGGQE
jgi:integrase